MNDAKCARKYYVAFSESNKKLKAFIEGHQFIKDFQMTVKRVFLALG